MHQIVDLTTCKVYAICLIGLVCLLDNISLDFTSVPNYKFNTRYFIFLSVTRSIVLVSEMGVCI